MSDSVTSCAVCKVQYTIKYGHLCTNSNQRTVHYSIQNPSGNISVMTSFEPSSSKVNQPQLIENEDIVCFDVDDTLILWNRPDSDLVVGDSSYKIHKKHIQSMKRFHSRGQFVIVWSKGGAKWAKKAVKLLGIEKYVNLVMAKPSWCFDDQPLSELAVLCYDKDE